MGYGSSFTEGPGGRLSRPHTTPESFEKRSRIVVGCYVALDTVQDTACDGYMEDVAGAMERFWFDQPLFGDLAASL